MRIHVAAAFLAASIGTGGLAWAGHPQDRQGFWIGFGGGYGSAIASADCEDCQGEDRQGSASGFLKLGGTLSDRVLLGVEVNAWTKDQDGVTLTLGNVSGTLTFYPQASSGFFLKVGAGAGVLDTSVDNLSINKTGFGLLGGLGYDIRVATSPSRPAPTTTGASPAT